MADLELAYLDEQILDRVKALMVAAPDTRLGVDPRLYTLDTVPPEPQEPYGVFELMPSGYGWDEGLDLGGTCGWPDLQVTGVGRLATSSRWVLDVVRSYMRAVDPATVATTGDTHLKMVSSMGPPTNPYDAGTLKNAVETYNLYVEAS